jgi:hypothetical protein
MAKPLIALLLAIGVAGCAHSDPTAEGTSSALHCTTPTDPAPSLGTPFNVRAGGRTTIASEGLSVTFSELVGESRCPRGVFCIRAGQVDVVIRAEHPSSATTDLELSTANLPATHATFGGYDVKLVDALPHPEAGREPTPASDYCVQLMVVRP